MSAPLQGLEGLAELRAAGRSSAEAVHSTVSWTHLRLTQPPVKRDMAMPRRP